MPYLLAYFTLFFQAKLKRCTKSFFPRSFTFFKGKLVVKKEMTT